MHETEAVHAATRHPPRNGIERNQYGAILVPPWVLILLRLRRNAGGDLAAAWATLPACLPAGEHLPSVDEAALVLLILGLVH